MFEAERHHLVCSTCICPLQWSSLGTSPPPGWEWLLSGPGHRVIHADRDEWWPERARERQNDLITIAFLRNTKQAAQCCSYCPVGLWCPHKCINKKSLDKHTQLNIKIIPHKSVSGTWWMVRTLLSSFQLRTNHTSSPSSTDAADEPLSKSELSFLRFSPSFFLFISCQNWSYIPRARADSMSQQWNVTWPIMLTWSGVHAIKLCHCDSRLSMWCKTSRRHLLNEEIPSLGK